MRGAETTLAAVFHGPGQPLELRNVPRPDRLLPGELIVRVTCCTVCGSDLSTLAGHRKEPTPCILGHEIVGVVEEMGSAGICDLRGREVRAGDRIVWSVVVHCGRCDRCRRGHPQKCTHLKKYGHHRWSSDWQLSGGFSEHCHLIAGTQCVVVNDSLSDEILSPASCATSTAAAALRVGGGARGARVLVFGSGLLGLTACAMVKAFGADSVTACDVREDRLELAKQFGADRTILWDQWQSGMNEAFDLVFEMTGNSDVVERCFHAADIGGRIVLVGSVRPVPAVSMLPEQVVRRLLSIHGMHNYTPQDLLAAVRFLEDFSNCFPFADIVGERYKLTEINDCLAKAKTSDSIRVAIQS